MDLVRLGEVLRDLRGPMSQAEASEVSGVQAHTIGRYERGDIEKPAFEDLVKLGLAYGVEPNDLAAVVGLVPEPSGEGEMEIYGPEVAQALWSLRAFLLNLQPEERREVAGQVNLIVEIHKRRREELRPSQVSATLPDWLQKKLRRRKE